MFLTFSGTLKTIKTIAKNQGLSLVFEDGGTQPRTDGKTIYVPKPDPYWNEDEITKWMYSVYHELRHNWPEFRELFKWAKDNKVDPQSFLGGIHNQLEDYRIEKYKNGQYEGERRALAKGRQLVSLQHMDKLGATRAMIEAAAQKHFGGRIPPDFNIDEQLAYRERTEAMMVWDQYNRESWQREIVGLADQMYDRLNPTSKGYVDKLRAGNYADRMNVSGILDLDTEYQICKDIIDEVFEMDSSEEEKKMQEQYQDGKGGQGEEQSGQKKQGKGQGKEGKDKQKRDVAGKVMWEDLQFHDHDENGPTYSPISIDYSNLERGRHYTPASPDEIKVYDMKKGDIKRRGYDGYADQIRKTNGGSLDKSVMRILQTLSVKRNSYGHRSGKIANRSLHKLKSPNPSTMQRVFRQRQSTITMDTSVCILCDLSGSMGGSKYTHSAKAAIMLNNAISKLGVPLEILGFTTEGYRLAHVVFKDYNARANEEQLTDYFDKASSMMNGNADGDSILWAYSRLAKQKSSKRVLIVLSDGYPAGRGHGIYEFTQDVVKGIEASPIDIYGIGIEDSAVKDIYKQHTVIRNASELEPKLLELVKSKILS